MRQQKDRLKHLGIEVLVVTFESMEYALNYKKETDLEYPLVVDNSKTLFDYYGMTKASFWDLWRPATWKIYIRELLKGNLPRPAHGDVYQRGGDVLIDPQGMVRLHHVGRGPADRPPVESILAIVEQEKLES